MDTVFDLPTADGANGVLKEWGRAAGIEHSFTWSCARLSFSVLLKDKNIDDATIAYLMGHTTTKQVQSTYKRHRPKDQTETIKALPTPENMPYYLVAMSFLGFAYTDMHAAEPEDTFIGMDKELWISRNRQKTGQEEASYFLT